MTALFAVLRDTHYMYRRRTRQVHHLLHRSGENLRTDSELADHDAEQAITDLIQTYKRVASHKQGKPQAGPKDMLTLTLAQGSNKNRAKNLMK